MSAPTCSGTCHLLLVIPSTIPMGKMTPQTAAWRIIWIHRIVSTGKFISSSVRTSLCGWARVSWIRDRLRIVHQKTCMPTLRNFKLGSSRTSTPMSCDFFEICTLMVISQDFRPSDWFRWWSNIRRLYTGYSPDCPSSPLSWWFKKYISRSLQLHINRVFYHQF